MVIASRCRVTAVLLGLLALPRPAGAEKDAAAQFRTLMAVQLQKKENHEALLKYLEKNVWPSFVDCGTGKDGVAIDPETWRYGFIFEYYPADRGRPPTAPDFVPSCYDPVPVCFRRDTGAPLEEDMKLYKDFPDTNECGLTSEKFTIREPFPKLDIKSVTFNGTITAKLKYWEKRTSSAKVSAGPSKRNAPRRARAGQVVTAVGYGIIVVDVYAIGTFLGAEREAEFKGPLESPNRRFCGTSEIAARSGPDCKAE
jgi:hypothetical protein